MIDLKPTNRGFLLGKFTDRYDNKCSIQKSSLATEDCIWLGVDVPFATEECPTCKTPQPPQSQRMHLTQKQVADLLPWLQRFVATGELPDCDGTNLNCYRIEDGGATVHMAARHAGEALNEYLGLQGGDCDGEEFTVTLVPDDKVPEFRIEQSEDRDKPEGYTLREALAKARAEGKAQLLCSTEF